MIIPKVDNANDEEINKDFTEFFKDKTNMVNLLIMNIAWSSVTFGYYLIGYYLKYIPGDIYTNVMLSSLAEVLACFFSGVVSSKYGIKATMILSFAMATVFGYALSFFTEESVADNYPLTIMCLVLLAKLGLTSAFSNCYLATVDYFPVLYGSRVFGSCNMASRFITILSPFLAEFKYPNPMVLFALANFVSMLTAFRL